MKGLYINFELKRRSKLDKIMDYFLVVTIGIFAIILFIYMPYVSRSNEITKLEKEKQALIVRRDDLSAQILPYLPESASQLQQNYNKAYNEIASSIINHTDYIEDIYSCKIEGVTITSIKIDTKTNIIKLGLHFTSNEVSYQYRANLSDLEWVPKNGIIWTDTSANTTWEVTISEPSK